MKRIANWPALFALLTAFVSWSLLAQTDPTRKAPKSEEKLSPTLAHEIHHQILVLPFYSVFDSITFILEGNRVILAGQVLRLTLKENAGAAVRSMEGVTTVVNNIEVLPVSPSDDDFRRAVYRALYEDSALARYAVQNVPAIHIIVKNGSVALEGSVDSLSDKNLAASRAGSVANVLSVKNNLVVHPKGSTAE